MCEPDMESAFNADLARQLAANCGAAVDKASREYPEVTIRFHWDPDAMKAVVEAWYHAPHDPVMVTHSLSIGTSVRDIDFWILGLPKCAIRAWRRTQPIPKAAVSTIGPEDDDIPF